MRKNVGISYWGLCYQFYDHKFSSLQTPDGHRYGRPLMISSLLNAGANVISLQREREPFTIGIDKFQTPLGKLNHDDGFPELDVLFLEWRWKTYKNDRTHPSFNKALYEPDYDRQVQLIEHYKTRCPIIAWDTDHKITADDELRWPELLIADPALLPRPLTRQRARLPFWSDWNSLISVSSPLPIYGLVGNNYERDEQFKKYYFDVQNTVRSKGVQVSMYGNWLQNSPERQSPQSLISDNPYVSFGHRMNFYDSMHVMNTFICTTHVSKQSYYETGFISPRYFEAVAVGCPALMPEEMAAGPAGPLFDEYIVKSSTDVFLAIKKLNCLSMNDRKGIVDRQKELLKSTGWFSVDRAVQAVLNVDEFKRDEGLT